MSAIAGPSTLPPRPHFPLPPRPVTAALPEPTYPAELAIQPASSSTSSAHAKSAICGLCSNPSKYTCPRCQISTCSLACSKSHKEKLGCSGQRDPGGFKSLAEYGQGDWAADYSYLESGRRLIATWATDPQLGPTGMRSAEDGVESRAPYAAGPKVKAKVKVDKGEQRKRRSKVQDLQFQLRRRGAWVEFMPDGMERRKKNQSSWAQRSQTLYLTMELVLPPSPKDDKGKRKSHYHHRVILDAPTDPKEGFATLASLVPAHLAVIDYVLVMPYHLSPAHPPAPQGTSKTWYFPPLDPTKRVREVLKGTAWAEYPTIYLEEKSSWTIRLKKNELGIMPLASAQESRGVAGEKRNVEKVAVDANEPISEAKKPKVVEKGLMALGAYGSDDESEDGEEE